MTDASKHSAYGEKLAIFDRDGYVTALTREPVFTNTGDELNYLRARHDNTQFWYDRAMEAEAKLRRLIAAVEDQGETWLSSYPGIGDALHE